MTVRDMMTSKVRTVSANASVETAAQIMKAQDVGWLPVTDNDNVVGVVSDRDLVVRGIGSGLSPDLTKVSQVMTMMPVVCPAETTVKEAIGLMRKEKIRRLLVIDGGDDGKPVGVVSLGDLASRNDSPEEAGKTLAEICRAQ